MEKVPKEVALKEIAAWLDFKKIPERDRKSKEAYIDALADYISDGSLSLDSEKFEFTQYLKFPTEGDAPVKTLSYKARLNAESIRAHLLNVPANDQYGSMFAYVACLTGTTKALVGKLDGVDLNVASAIVIFFM